MPHGLNSPMDVYFFTKRPGQYTLPPGYHEYEINRAHENSIEQAISKTRSNTRLEIVHFGKPTVEVQEDKYTYIVQSSATRDQFKMVMSPEYVNLAKATGLRGLHYAAVDTWGDAVGITVEAETPEKAKEQFLAWYAKVNDALKALSERFAIINKELDQKIQEWVAKRLDELNRAKKAL